jgi:hypothetical protein
VKTPINTTANKSIITIDIASWLPSNESIYILDLKQFLFKELILKEEEYKQAIDTFDWSQIKDKYCMIYCSNNAIVPTWAYMLLCSKLAQNSIYYSYANSKDDFKNQYLIDKINQLKTDEYENQRLVIKGCGDKSIKEDIYMKLTAKLLPIVRSIAYGEPCSMVPIYKKRID